MTSKVILEGFNNQEEAKSFVASIIRECGLVRYTEIHGDYYIDVREEIEQDPQLNQD